jgi:hypothetical protein
MNLKEVNFSKTKQIRADMRQVRLPKAILTGADCSECALQEAMLIGADLCNTNLRKIWADHSSFTSCNLMGADLRRSKLQLTRFTKSNLSKADLFGADLSQANFYRSNLRHTNLGFTTLSNAHFVEADLENAKISNATVYGCAVWNVNLANAKQSNLLISAPGENPITCDDLELAQFIYLLLNNNNIRHVIDTITSKVVLILGRFTSERKAILDKIRNELRKKDYVPVIFDFEKPSNRDITETVSTLAHMARFVIADLSDPRSIPHELAHVAPLLPSVPIMPLIVRPQKEYAMFEHFFGFRHVLKPFRYRDESHLLSALTNKVIVPSEKMALRVAGKRS